MFSFEVYLQIIFLQVILLKLPIKATYGHHYFCIIFGQQHLYTDICQHQCNTVNLTSNQVGEKTIIQYTNYTKLIFDILDQPLCPLLRGCPFFNETYFMQTIQIQTAAIITFAYTLTTPLVTLSLHILETKP